MICSNAQPKSILSQIGRKIAKVKRIFGPASCVPLAKTDNSTLGSPKGYKPTNIQPIPKGEIHMWCYFAMERI